MNEIVKAAQIFGSCLLIGCGVLAVAIGAPPTAYAPSFGGVGAAVGGVCAVLGLWLLITAWVGKNPVALFFESLQESKPPVDASAPDKPPTDS